MVIRKYNWWIGLPDLLLASKWIHLVGSTYLLVENQATGLQNQWRPNSGPSRNCYKWINQILAGSESGNRIHLPLTSFKPTSSSTLKIHHKLFIDPANVNYVGSFNGDFLQHCKKALSQLPGKIWNHMETKNVTGCLKSKRSAMRS